MQAWAADWSPVVQVQAFSQDARSWETVKCAAMTCVLLSAVASKRRMNKYVQTIQTIRSVREKTDTAVLFYSAGGKDSIVLLDMLAQAFEKVICYYMYVIRDLDHIQPYIQWAVKRYGNVEVRQIEHYQKDYIDKIGVFKDADPAYQLPKKDPNHKRTRTVGDVEEMVRRETGIKWAFSGMKGVDGYMKRMRLKTFLKRNGDYVTEKGMVYPLAVWTNKEVLQYIRQKNLIHPFVYHVMDISQGFGIDVNILLLMREKYPRDYRRILEEFPYSEKLVFDYEREQDKAV